MLFLGLYRKWDLLSIQSNSASDSTNNSSLPHFPLSWHEKPWTISVNSLKMTNSLTENFSHWHLLRASPRCIVASVTSEWEKTRN